MLSFMMFSTIYSLRFYKTIFSRMWREATLYREFFRGFRLLNDWLVDRAEQVPHNHVWRITIATLAGTAARLLPLGRLAVCEGFGVIFPWWQFWRQQCWQVQVRSRFLLGWSLGFRYCLALMPYWKQLTPTRVLCGNPKIERKTTIILVLLFFDDLQRYNEGD